MDYTSAKRNEIVDYENDDGTVTPMLVVHVNDQEDGDGSVVGIVFSTDGHSRAVTIPGPEADPTVKAEQDAEASFSGLSADEQRAVIRDELARMTAADRDRLRIEFNGPADTPSSPPEATPAEPATGGDQTPPVPAPTDSPDPGNAGTDGPDSANSVQE